MSFKFGMLLLVLLYSTGFCSKLGKCSDKRPDCKELVRDNHCHSNPYTTLRECPKACGVCKHCKCVDTRPDCHRLADDCHRNPYATIKACPVTCGACG